jgi:hypothetical protein
MSLRQNIPGRRPDGVDMGRPDGQLCDERPDGYSLTRNFQICNARVRTMVGSHPDG